MINQNYNLKNISTREVIVYGAGTLGKITQKILSDYGKEIKFFCDSDKKKFNLEIKKKRVISPEELDNLDKDLDIIVSNNYINAVIPDLLKLGFKNIFSATELFKYVDYDNIGNQIKTEGANENLAPLKIKREIDFYNEIWRVEEYKNKNILNIKTIDIQITEKCSLKCKDCSNLMQYYTKPIDNDFEVLKKSVTKMMNCIDQLDEFRVIGGDPFMNKQLYTIIDFLKKFNNCKNIVIYTNARIVPKGKNLECLKHEKVLLDITNYGLSSSAHDKIIELAEKENIKYSTFRCTTWQDCGRIIPHSKKNEDEIKKQFNNCCNSDLISLLHGKLYRCPFSANGTNLGAFPVNKKEFVDLLDDNKSISDTKEAIKTLCYDIKFLSACFYCNGRDFTTPTIPSALQTKEILKF